MTKRLPPDTDAWFGVCTHSHRSAVGSIRSSNSVGRRGMARCASSASRPGHFAPRAIGAVRSPCGTATGAGAGDYYLWPRLGGNWHVVDLLSTTRVL